MDMVESVVRSLRSMRSLLPANERNERYSSFRFLLFFFLVSTLGKSFVGPSFYCLHFVSRENIFSNQSQILMCKNFAPEKICKIVQG